MPSPFPGMDPWLGGEKEYLRKIPGPARRPNDRPQRQTLLGTHAANPRAAHSP